MRKNTQEVFAAWEKGKACRSSDSIWTDGVSIYSYNTALLTRKADGMLILNATKYSNTTSRQQSDLREMLVGERFDSITGAPQGYYDWQLAGN